MPGIALQLLLYLPTPLTPVCGVSPIIPCLVHQPAYISNGQQLNHSSRICPQMQGSQYGAYVGEVGEMMCVVCVSVTEGAYIYLF